MIVGGIIYYEAIKIRLINKKKMRKNELWRDIYTLLNLSEQKTGLE